MNNTFIDINFNALCIRPTDSFNIKHILAAEIMRACICLVLRNNNVFYLNFVTEWSLYYADVVYLVCGRTDCWKHLVSASVYDASWQNCKSATCVCSSGTIRLPLDGFTWNFMTECFSLICRENSSFIKIWQRMTDTVHEDLFLGNCPIWRAYSFQYIYL